MEPEISNVGWGCLKERELATNTRFWLDGYPPASRLSCTFLDIAISIVPPIAFHIIITFDGALTSITS